MSLSMTSQESALSETKVVFLHNCCSPCGTGSPHSATTTGTRKGQMIRDIWQQRTVASFVQSAASSDTHALHGEVTTLSCCCTDCLMCAFAICCYLVTSTVSLLMRVSVTFKTDHSIATRRQFGLLKVNLCMDLSLVAHLKFKYEAQQLWMHSKKCCAGVNSTPDHCHVTGYSACCP